MIKLIREVNRRFPWLLASLIGIIAITFVVGMGWFGFSGVQGNSVATVGDLTVSLDEYRRVRRNLQDFYRDTLKQEIKPEALEQTALNTLITSKVWTLAAEDLGLIISPSELRADIIKTQAFQKDGKFNPEVYRQILAVNKLTPAHYEAQQRIQLLGDKAKALVQESVALTPSEVEEAQTLMNRQASNAASPGPAQDKILKIFLSQKQQRALQVYTESLKAKYEVKIQRENL